MSETKHAKGPWRWSRTYGMGIKRLHWCLESDESAAEGKTIDGSLVLRLHEDTYCGEPFLNNPNARLIAAAPELLEALEDAMRWFGKLEDWRGVGDPDIEKYRAAIAKAKGEK